MFFFSLDCMTSNNGFYGDEILYKKLEFFRALRGSALENRRKWYGFGSSTVFQTVRYTVSESTVSDGTVAHTTVFQMVFGLVSNNKGFPQPYCGVVSQGVFSPVPSLSTVLVCLAPLAQKCFVHQPYTRIKHPLTSTILLCIPQSGFVAKI